MGEEAKGHPLKAFVPEFLAFQRRCASAGVSIPFLFHCGETLEGGTATDENLVDALLLGARRIGHGFALARHPHVLQRMRAAGVCLELCPISNEVLGLTGRVAGHAMYQLLAANVHCTVSSDNGTIFRCALPLTLSLFLLLLCPRIIPSHPLSYRPILPIYIAATCSSRFLVSTPLCCVETDTFLSTNRRSSLSHDFYQVMVGKADMDLFGWKQLVLWSLEHACLGDAERRRVLLAWEAQWDEYLRWLVDAHGDVLDDEVDDDDDDDDDGGDVDAEYGDAEHE